MKKHSLNESVFNYYYGGLGQNRTADTRFFRPLLYRLSYKTIMAVLTGIQPATPPWQGDMLALHYRTMVAGDGFEPTTFRLWAWWANQTALPRDVMKALIIIYQQLSFFINFKWRRLRDSNPRALLSTSRFSRPNPSATWVSLHKSRN